MNILNMVACCSEDYGLLFVALDQLPHHIEQWSGFLTWPNNEEMEFKIIRELRLLVDLDDSVVLDATQRKVFNLWWNSGWEKQTLPAFWHSVGNFLDLFCKPHLKESIRLIIDNYFDSIELEACLLNAMHKSSWSRDNDVRV